ncbi:MAG: flagellar hook-associated protein FlgK [Planctomycetaceae bacterium]|nr:flagellar hook-associated protein FlgK [Planctomycetaceae bacterium]
MGLIGALNIGRSALGVNQAALEVAGNNLANAATEGYTRQSAVLAPVIGQEIAPGTFVGGGVRLLAVVRHTDEALLSRLRSAISDREAAGTLQDVLTQLESIQNELQDDGLSSRMSEFFNAWSQLANNPADNALRTLVVNQGASLGEFVNRLSVDLGVLRRHVDESIRGSGQQASTILEQIAELNARIVVAERGQGGANGLRDQRDQLLDELAEYVDISTIEQDSGGVDVFIGSTPVVLAGASRGIRVEFTANAAGDLEVAVRVDADGTLLRPRSGRIGQLIDARTNEIDSAVTAVSDFAGQLIHQTNLVHSQGQGDQFFSSLTGSVQVADTTASLDAAAAELAFPPSHGSFMLHVHQVSTGAQFTAQIDVDMDAIGGPNMSLEDLRDAINAEAAINGFMTASITPQASLQLDAVSSDFQFSFSDDSSGVLAGLGLNTFFVGEDASDIAVNQVVLDTPALLATGLGHQPGDNRTALAMADLQDQAIAGLGGFSLREQWTRHIEDVGVRTSQASRQAEAEQIVLEGLEAQQQAIGGVSIDDESISLLGFQRSFQGSARFISVVDEMMTTLLGLVQ